MDEIASINRDNFTRDIAEGRGYTIPWLDLDITAFIACRNGDGPLPTPYRDDPVDRLMMSGASGKNVLLLAGGGGQQSAVFSLLGASVTVLDLTPGQLEGDAIASKHYGYPVELIEGDMRDLSCLPSEHFDRVYQPISTLYVPDLKVVYAGVYRVLKHGGLYFADYCFPALGMANDVHWDGEAYTLRISSPYRRGRILEDGAGHLSLTKGELFFGEFNHLLSDIINGLLESGLRLYRLWENPRPGSTVDLEKLQPGSEEHQNQFIPFGISVVVEKG
jgi:SAM-dependent methyltransferase